MKIASKCNIAFGRRNVLPLYDPLLVTATYTVPAFKIHVSDHRRRRLHTVAVIKPQKEGRKQKQKRYARNR